MPSSYHMNWELLASIFFPRRCVACGTLLRAGVICEPCFGTIALERAPLSLRAGGGRDGRGWLDLPYLIGAAANYRTPALAAPFARPTWSPSPQQGHDSRLHATIAVW